MGGLLTGRRAFITGAARGIGAATARRLAEEGAKVALNDLDGEGAERQADELRSRGFDAYGTQLDVTADGAVSEALDEAARRFGGVDLVVANAGVLTSGRVDQTPVEQFQRVLQINVGGVYSVFHHAVPHLRAAGGGVLLATSSLAGKQGVTNLAAYSASKFAVVGLVESLSNEVAGEGIRVCAVAPGFVDTAMLDPFTSDKAASTGRSVDDARKGMIESIPLGRLITPEEVANTFVYLASPLASGVTGELLTVSGGGH
ncbi:SDR family NAD(P)-dependent oxidoreductase [Mycobacterium sp. ACS4331]|uniref:SDR family NAD(P)-dependent oxidoreductase n=1 Tax=Mycobacterium sp. ACS4331 TaxID=1834121 RepID=UPI0008021480|nr:SDR family NAD(P)-dependent oxidoreductase [Mycobacterium sp. ACS4331]OBF13736.1 hypothetical protein A5727_16920 [Mycobacterium sp. ACS4331]